MKRLGIVIVLTLLLIFLYGCSFGLSPTQSVDLTPFETFATDRPSEPFETDATRPNEPTDLSLYSGHELDLRINLSKWGLGNTILRYLSLNRDYNWYRDQHSTEPFGIHNCVLTSIYMVAKYLNPDHPFSVNEARLNTKPEEATGYSYREARALLEKANIRYESKLMEALSDLIGFLERGYVAIAFVDMRVVPFGAFDSESRVNRYSLQPGLHAVVVKGLLETDKGIFIEVYDPDSNNKTYSNQTPLGMNRYIEWDHFMKAILRNESHLLVIIEEILPND